MRTIWLVRHGQSQAQTGEDEDWQNPALSELGRQQAQRLVERLDGIEFDRILLSPFRRAWKTYELSQAQGRVVEFDSRIIESDWGIPNCYEPLLPLETPSWGQPDRHGALLTGVDERVANLLSELLAEPEGSALLFGHWGVFSRVHRAFVGANGDAPPVTAHMDNTAISVLELDEKGNRVLRCWNDRSHVADILE